MESGLLVYFSAIASSVAIVVTALRKRRDVNYAEMQQRIDGLVERVEHLEGALDSTQAELVVAERDRFKLRRVLAQHGIADPTLETA